jgi:hypothetical protein
MLGLIYAMLLSSQHGNAASISGAQRQDIFVIDAHRNGKRFVVRADEKLTAFVELERAIYEFAVDLIS